MILYLDNILSEDLRQGRCLDNKNRRADQIYNAEVYFAQFRLQLDTCAGTQGMSPNRRWESVSYFQILFPPPGCDVLLPVLSTKRYFPLCISRGIFKPYHPTHWGRVADASYRDDYVLQIFLDISIS